MAQTAKVKFTTGIVPLLFCHLNREDPTYGGYKVAVDLPKGHPLIERIDAFVEDNYTPAQKKHAKFKRGYKPQEDGVVRIQVSTKHKPPLFDAKGNPVDVVVFGGSTGIVAGVIDIGQGTDPGVKLRLNSVQIAKLQRGGPQDISGELEDAFVADEDDRPSATSNPRVARQQETAVAPADDIEDDEIPF